MEPEMPPTRVDRGVHRPLEAFLLHAVRHVRAVPGHLPPDERIRAGPDGLGVGRQIDAGGVGAHLVVINKRLGDPLAEENLAPVP